MAARRLKTWLGGFLRKEGRRPAASRPSLADGEGEGPADEGREDSGRRPLQHLDEVLSSRPPMVTRLLIIRQLCLELQGLHARNRVHNDLKLYNVLLRVRSPGDVRVVLHSTCASTAGAELASFRGLREVAEVLGEGCFPWVAPELLGGAPATPATDVYSLGRAINYILPARYELRLSLYAKLALEGARSRPSVEELLSVVDAELRAASDWEPPAGGEARGPGTSPGGGAEGRRPLVLDPATDLGDGFRLLEDALASCPSDATKLLVVRGVADELARSRGARRYFTDLRIRNVHARITSEEEVEVRIGSAALPSDGRVPRRARPWLAGRLVSHESNVFSLAWIVWMVVRGMEQRPEGLYRRAMLTFESFPPCSARDFLQEVDEELKARRPCWSPGI